jgi:CRISPR/Cas system-associated endoribonuclease Cas2
LIYIVTYDLKSPNDTDFDYKRVIDALKGNFKNWCHLQKSVWVVESDEAASEIRDWMKSYLYTSDVLFVARLSGTWASYNLGAERATWVKSKTF